MVRGAGPSSAKRAFWVSFAAALLLITLHSRGHAQAQASSAEEASRSRAFQLYNAGRYGEAEALYRQVLQAFEGRLGREHPETLRAVTDLTSVYVALGRYREAEPLYRRALESQERVLGRDDPVTLFTLNNLAGLYVVQGRYREAEPLYVRALAARERTLGRDNAETLATVFNLAILYRHEARYDEAERSQQRQPRLLLLQQLLLPWARAAPATALRPQKRRCKGWQGRVPPLEPRQPSYQPRPLHQHRRQH